MPPALRFRAAPAAAMMPAMMPALVSALVSALLAALAAPLARAAAQPAASPSPLIEESEQRALAVMPKVTAWRRDLHEHPELSGEEVRTAALVADHLRALGIEVRTGVGGHGVVGVLRGGKPGPVVALRADMDGLPVEELVELPFKSRVKGSYRGAPVGVMHACGHDNHVAVLMGAAEVLAGMRAKLPGTVKFVFQPAEEGLPNGGTGAVEMLKDGVLDNPRVDAIFGMHVGNGPLGRITYRPGPSMAASNGFTITIHGKQTHG
ncbi:MAG: hypothetical protein RLZ32_2662, partial [Gemmatimonadota bacterium]